MLRIRPEARSAGEWVRSNGWCRWRCWGRGEFDRFGVGRVTCDNHPIGVLAITDQLRPEAAAAIDASARLTSTAPVPLTGDNQATADQLAARVGISDVACRERGWCAGSRDQAWPPAAGFLLCTYGDKTTVSSRVGPRRGFCDHLSDGAAADSQRHADSTRQLASAGPRRWGRHASHDDTNRLETLEDNTSTRECVVLARATSAHFPCESARPRLVRTPTAYRWPRLAGRPVIDGHEGQARGDPSATTHSRQCRSTTGEGPCTEAR